MDYREILILLYMNSVKQNYVYSDLVELLGLTYDYVIDKVDHLIDEEYLFINKNGSLEVGIKGSEVLSENNFLDITIFDLYDTRGLVNERISLSPLEINDIYVPENFDKKFKGY